MDEDGARWEELSARYRQDPFAYLHEVLGWEPWRGTPETPGQAEVVAAYRAALLAQEQTQGNSAGDAAGNPSGDAAGNVRNRLRLVAGHNVGKTKLCSGLVNHFFDCFYPAIIYTFAPSWAQIHDLLWKELKRDRRAAGSRGIRLPGRLLDVELRGGPDHFARGRATHNAGDGGLERLQGQHGRHLMFVLDEAEGIAPYVWDAVDTMTSGGICIVLAAGNPRTRTSRFHRMAALPSVESFRISSLTHPNVVQGSEVVPGAVGRPWVEGMLATHCRRVERRDADRHTFTLPWRPGDIFQPDDVFLYRVLGLAPENLSEDALVPPGRLEAAWARGTQGGLFGEAWARAGVDAARYGGDCGVIFIRRGPTVWREALLRRQDNRAYARMVLAAARRLAAQGVTSFQLRVDGGGGFGGGLADLLKDDLELQRLFPDWRVTEVHFNGTPRDEMAYADLGSELYCAAAEALKELALAQGQDEGRAELLADLCERRFRWAVRGGREVRRLEPKDDFRKRQGRSPDHGDAFVLAVAGDHLLRHRALDVF